MSHPAASIRGARRIPAILVSIALALTAAACGSSSTAHPQASAASSAAPPGCPTDKDGGDLGIVLGYRANSLTPVFSAALTSQTQSLISAAANAKPPSTIVVTEIDGAPEPQYVGAFSTTSVNSAGKQQDLDQYQSNLLAGMGSLKPAHPQADILTAIRKTAEQMTGKGTIIVADSGLQTTDPLDFRRPGLLEAAPGDIAKSLLSQGELPDLHGKRIILAGIGQSTAPQPDLDLPLITDLKNIWNAVLTAAGACVSYQPNATSSSLSPTPAGYPPVGIVPLPVPPPPPSGTSVCGTTSFPDSGTVGFEQGSTDFRQPDKATAVLQAYAAKVKPLLPGITIQVVGTTATWGTEQYRLDLSARRAQTVAAVLEKSGIPSSVLQPKGVGTDWPTHVKDVKSSGELDPVLAEQNRSVVLVGHCTGGPTS